MTLNSVTVSPPEPWGSAHGPAGSGGGDGDEGGGGGGGLGEEGGRLTAELEHASVAMALVMPVKLDAPLSTQKYDAFNSPRVPQSTQSDPYGHTL